MKIKQTMMGLVLSTVMALTVSAGEQAGMSNMEHFYVGIGFGQVTHNLDSDHVFEPLVTDDEDNSQKFFAGYRFNSLIGVEGYYTNLGEITGESGGEEETIDMDGYGLDVVLSTHFGAEDKVSVFGKLGMFKGTAEISGDKETSTEMHYGLGLGYDINDRFAVRVEYDEYAFEDVSSSAYGLGLVIKI